MTSSEPALDLNLLRTLAVVVQEASVTRAAERLGVSQPAVSAALRRLRQSLGDPLLVRSGQTMSPTPRAQELAERMAPLLAGLHEAVVRRRAFEPQRTRRTFTLMGSDYVQFFVLPPLCAKLQAEAPQVVLAHRPANPSKVEAWLESGQVDLGIGYLASPPPALRTRLLFGDEQVCVLRRGHPALKPALTLERYAELQHVAISPAGAGIYGARLDGLLASLGIRRQIGLTLPSFLAMPYVVARTDAIATVPARFARYFSRLLPLAVVEPPVTLPRFEISMFWHERLHADQANVWLRREVVEAAREVGA